jgi:hypothetical protein
MHAVIDDLRKLPGIHADRFFGPQRNQGFIGISGIRKIDHNGRRSDASRAPECAQRRRNRGSLLSIAL